MPRAAAALPIAYAYVNWDGTVFAAQSRNVSTSNVTLDGTSSFCFHDLPFTVHGAVATIDYGYVQPDGGKTAVATVALGQTGTDCSATTNLQLEVATAVGGAYAPAAFFIIFY